MDTLPLPPRPNLEQYRKRAKHLVAAAKSKDPNAVRAWATEWLDTLVGLLGITVTPFVQHSLERAVDSIEAHVRKTLAASRNADTAFTLADAQFLMARAHGFENWAEFANHVEQVPRQGQPFESAIDAVVSGDLPALASLLREQPELIRARSKRVHRAMLLHYVAANGVEDFRQKTPPNAVAVARLLLEAGAEVDALANTYGGGTAQTTMNLLVSSTHPADAGLHGPLIETLVEYGAAINGVENDGSPLMTALFFGYIEAAETLAKCGARIDTAVAAAALGRLDLVQSFVIDARTLRGEVKRVAASWVQLPHDAKQHIELALVFAAKFGRTDVVRYLLDLGVDPASCDGDHMTALHVAAANRHLDVVRLLLAHGAPLEVQNDWGGTVLDSTLWFVRNQPVRRPLTDGETDYATIIETLLEAGADIRAIGDVGSHTSGDEQVDAVLRRWLSR
jgi:ankyrin repeat protein